MVVTLHLDAAGGPEHLPGDYVYGNHRGPYLDAGQWGILRVHVPDDQTAGLLPLLETPASTLPLPAVIVMTVLGLAVLVGAGTVLYRRRPRAREG